ncbi:MAG: hypothetical protein ABI778_02510 [Ignavibacteriota bacterium]
MKHFALLLLVTLGFISCSRTDEKVGQPNDSLLTKPMVVEQVPEIIVHDSSSGLVVDQSSFRTPQHEALLQRFEPVDVAKIYQAFKVIRKPGITEEQTAKFLKEKKITLDELKAILEEGDMLGWGKK